MKLQYAVLRATLFVFLSFTAPMLNAGPPQINARLVTSFEWDSTHQFFAESITVGRDGNIYGGVSDNLSTLCQIVRFTPDGRQKKVVATFPPTTCDAGGFLLGVAFDEENKLHVIAMTFNPSAGPPGVYRIGDDGSVTCVLSLPTGSFPNGLAFYHGDMYVSDSALGAIWKKRPHDSTTASVPWFQSIPLLAPQGFGANGIAFFGNALYISVSDAGSIIRLPILHNGSPGVPEVAAQPDPRLVTLDGIAFDITGRIWFTVNTGSGGAGGKLGTLDQDGRLKFLADSPGWLDYPVMVVFGTTFWTQGTLYLSNAGFNGGQSNILAFDVGVPGIPLPAH